jgi:hypothetical protein
VWCEAEHVGAQAEAVGRGRRSGLPPDPVDVELLTKDVVLGDEPQAAGTERREDRRVPGYVGVA